MNNKGIIDYYQTLDSNLSLDEKLFMLQKKFFPSSSFEDAKNELLKNLGINQYEYYTKNVNVNLRAYIEKYIFPQYALNDQGHGILHIREVIRRAFALNDTFKLHLNPDMIYAIAACHDLGKYIDHKTHHLIAAQKFIEDENFKLFFSQQQREIIHDAIEDHRSSKEDSPRTDYGKLISSADRNTTIEIVFIRSFYVALERTPEMRIDEYLDYTLQRLRKKYDEKNPENMFYEDKIYSLFLKDMRTLLSKPEEFNALYCKVNEITDRKQTVKEAHDKRNKRWLDERCK